MEDELCLPEAPQRHLLLSQSSWHGGFWVDGDVPIFKQALTAILLLVQARGHATYSRSVPDVPPFCDFL